MSTAAPLPNPRRVVLGTDASGTSIAWKNEEVVMEDVRSKTMRKGKVWATENLVADVQTGKDGAGIKTETIVNQSGSICQYIDFAPGMNFPVHYTHSIDYGVVINGEPILGLSDGTRVQLKQGDNITQLGALHSWHNESDSWSRIFWVILPAKPVLIDGQPLPTDKHFP